EEEAVRMHLAGLANALRHLGMLPGEAAPPRADMQCVDRFVWLRSAEAGWWESDVRAGDAVRAGSSIGSVRNLFGDVIERVLAPEDGVVLFVTTSAAVTADGLLLGLGAGLSPL
ncbi:MAG: uncharacterized protein QOF43_1628, partial [Gaiellaceae bacterium]|nr:uncharacterized protein [Gaiellaceae bacterium]